MNDTILTTRQEKILELLRNKKGLSRIDINNQLSFIKPVSRITLIRDINALINSGYIQQVGKGRATVYRLRKQNKLLYYANLEEYFNKSSWDRNAQKGFNNSVFDDLPLLFTEDEKQYLEKATANLDEKSKKLNPTIYKRELERFIIEFSWKSSQIEGNTYDLLETETLIKQKIEAKGRSKAEAIMILNHKEAFDVILKKPSNFRTLSFADVTQLHTLLIKGLNISSGIRKQRVGISGTEYVPMVDKTSLEQALRKTINVINKVGFPPGKALIASFMIAYIQPFFDGNKRVARTLANAILIAYNYFPLSYRNVEVDEYKKAIIMFYEQNNLCHLKRIFLEQIRFSTENYFKTK